MLNIINLVFEKKGRPISQTTNPLTPRNQKHRPSAAKIVKIKIKSKVLIQAKPELTYARSQLAQSLDLFQGVNSSEA